MRNIAVAALAVLLTGCQTDTTSPYDMTEAETEALRQQHDKTCQSFGAKPGTEFYFNCRHKMAEQEMASRDAEQDRRIAKMRRAAEQMQNTSVNSFSPGNRAVNCTSTRTAAGTVRTNCY